MLSRYKYCQVNVNNANQIFIIQCLLNLITLSILLNFLNKKVYVMLIKFKKEGLHLYLLALLYNNSNSQCDLTCAGFREIQV